MDIQEMNYLHQVISHLSDEMYERFPELKTIRIQLEENIEDYFYGGEDYGFEEEDD